MSALHTYEGACHCGALRVSMSLTTRAEATPVHSCQCGFCTRRGTRTIFDAAGRALLVLDPQHLTRYRIGTQTADLLVCRRCGCYVGAMMEDGGRTLAIANTRGLGMTEFDAVASKKLEVGDETLAARLARRRARWTPAEGRYAPAPAPGGAP